MSKTLVERERLKRNDLVSACSKKISFCLKEHWMSGFKAGIEQSMFFVYEFSEVNPDLNCRELAIKLNEWATDSKRHDPENPENWGKNV